MFNPMFGYNPTDIGWNDVQLGQRAPGNLQVGAGFGSDMTSTANPVLPALWWLGGVILLVVIRYLWEKS